MTIYYATVTSLTFLDIFWRPNPMEEGGNPRGIDPTTEVVNKVTEVVKLEEAKPISDQNGKDHLNHTNFKT